MSKRRRSGKGRGKQAGPQPVEFWHLAGPLPDGPSSVSNEDPSATLLSLGPPPLPGQPEAQKHIVLVAARAAAVAAALAAAAEIPDGDHTDA